MEMSQKHLGVMKDSAAEWSRNRVAKFQKPETLVAGKGEVSPEQKPEWPEFFSRQRKAKGWKRGLQKGGAERIARHPTSPFGHCYLVAILDLLEQVSLEIFYHDIMATTVPVFIKQFPQEVGNARNVAVSSRLWNWTSQARIDFLFSLVKFLELKECVVDVGKDYEEFCSMEKARSNSPAARIGTWTLPQDLEHLLMGAKMGLVVSPSQKVCSEATEWRPSYCAWRVQHCERSDFTDEDKRPR
ncbi:uncharacterized protein LY89DRAFT_673473 [Mollisia scopiformis]|uniref:Uncharacterized protein n=1 Tax=Mollisia scopiformis TaxID=149040 RepID=A0A194WX00_MOLSC|nr:uncharacterized protein LY89DRAFT_673473 [Mollisia scopiformis]KUJ12506.1 hypothetical protein LY89DRAFT_673473 [Mollisia scopiformis]